MTVQSVTMLSDKVSGLLDDLSGSTLVTDAQVQELASAFSSSVYNSGSKTAEVINKQIVELEQLLDAIEAKIDALYAREKATNQKMINYVNDLNDATSDITKTTAEELRIQRDEVSAAIDEAFKSYMKGDIKREEIPLKIAEKLQNKSANDGLKLKSSLDSMDSMSTNIKNLSDEIAGILDTINSAKSQYQTTKASKTVLDILASSIPQQAARANIVNVAGNYPLYDPQQTALMSDYMAVYSTATTGRDVYSSGNNAVMSMGKDLGGDFTNGGYTANAIHSKEELNALAGDDLEAALDPQNTNYSVLEKLYLSGMKDTDGGYIQAAYAISRLYGSAAVGFSVGKGLINVPKGHDGVSSAIYNDLINQYNQLWGQNAQGENVVADAGGITKTDPIGYTIGKTSYEFVVDRNEDGIFNDSSEFLGATGQGWNELLTFDTNGDNKLTGEELDGLMVLSTNQALKNGGEYAFMNASMAGVDSIDLASYTTAGAHTDINNSSVIGTFGLTVNHLAVEGQQTEATEQYLTSFFSHTYGQQFAFTIDPDAVAAALEDANEVGSNEQEIAILKQIAANVKATVKSASETATQNVKDKQDALDYANDSSEILSMAPVLGTEDSAKSKKLSDVLENVYGLLF